MAIYKAIIKAHYNQQAIANVLYYRTGAGLDMGGFTWGGADSLAGLIKDNIVPALAQCLPSEYVAEEIEVSSYYDNSFDLMLSKPYVMALGTGIPGNMSAQTDGPGLCCILKANLEPTLLITNGPKPPNRGYVAIGPVPSDVVDNTGHITNVLPFLYKNRLDDLCAALGEDLASLVPPVIFFPIRVRTDRVANVFKITSYADVSGFVTKNRVSFRRSRMPEI